MVKRLFRWSNPFVYISRWPNIALLDDQIFSFYFLVTFRFSHTFRWSNTLIRWTNPWFLILDDQPLIPLLDDQNLGFFYCLQLMIDMASKIRVEYSKKDPHMHEVEAWIASLLGTHLNQDQSQCKKEVLSLSCALSLPHVSLCLRGHH